MHSRNNKITSFLLTLYFFPVLFLLILAAGSLYRDIPIAIFTRDPASTANIFPLSGVASHFGVLLLITSGAICLFSWMISKAQLGKGRFSLFLLCSGLLSILLGLDDLLILHEAIYPRFLGINEKITFLIYGLLTIGGSVKFRKEILKSDYLILLIALGFLGLSLIVDGFENYIETAVGQWRIFIEDGFKFLGIVAWFGYFLRCCLMITSRE